MLLGSRLSEHALNAVESETQRHELCCGWLLYIYKGSMRVWLYGKDKKGVYLYNLHSLLSFLARPFGLLG